MADVGGRELPGWLERCEAEAGVGVGSGSQSTGTGAEAAHLVDVEPVLAGCSRGLGAPARGASGRGPVAVLLDSGPPLCLHAIASGVSLC